MAHNLKIIPFQNNWEKTIEAYLSNGTGPYNAPRYFTGVTILLRACNENIQRILKMTKDMIRLAEEGDLQREDTGCGVLYGLLRDYAFKLKQLAEEEKKAHMRKGWWKEE